MTINNLISMIATIHSIMYVHRYSNINLQERSLINITFLSERFTRTNFRAEISNRNFIIITTPPDHPYRSTNFSVKEGPRVFNTKFSDIIADSVLDITPSDQKFSACSVYLFLPLSNIHNPMY